MTAVLTLSSRRRRNRDYASLRDDVQRFVVASIARAPINAGRESYEAYSRFRNALSAICGDDAPPGWRDERQYQRAVQFYCAEVGL